MPNNLKHFLKIALIVLLVAGVLGYGWFGARNFLAGPVIIIESPKTGTTLHEPLIEVKGVARNIADISLNGRKIFTDKAGVWSEKVLLHPGYNVVTLSASDRFDRETEEKLELVLKETQHVTLAPN